MARNVTLGQLRADVQWQADVTGATTRHVASMLNRAINQSIQRFRERVTAEGSTLYLSKATGTFTAGNTSPHPFQLLDLSAVSPSIVRINGVDITVNGEVHQLSHVPFTHRDQYGSSTGEPMAWASAGQRQLAILPGPDAAYAYCIWHLPVLADLTVDSSTFDGVAGWEEYVVWDVVARVVVRDQTAKAYGMAMAAQQSAWRDIMAAAPYAADDGAVIARDTFGERLAGLSRSRRNDPQWRWR